MSTGEKRQAPIKSSYDVVIVGGAMLGSSTAWFLSSNPDFDGSILVVEKDPTYEACSTAHTNSCIRQQFSQEINVRCSQFAAQYIKDFRANMGGDTRIPDLTIQSYGYLYLADTEKFADVLRSSHKSQVAAGAGTKLLSAADVKTAYPFYNTDDIVLASHNLIDEGYWDGGTVFEWWRRSARGRGVEYIDNAVVGMTKNAAGSRVEYVTLASGEKVAAGHVVNASGPRAVLTSRMAGIELPVEPRKRFSYVFSAAQPIEGELPLTIDPTGVHMRQDGPSSYLAGCASDIDLAVDYDDFTIDHSLWEEKVWPALATRIPQFEALKLTNVWAGHYAYNTLDQNAIIGPHDAVENFMFLNGFSGHGLQQSPAMGRGMSELLIYGEYRNLDLSPFAYGRIARNEPFAEKAVI
jgi:glycine/D-amino acid oxidase-like deaminating enzyme